MYYSQGQEQKYIVEYFGGFVGTLCSIGENDGKCFSNALRLIELGWSAVCVEPSPNAFGKLKEFHKDNNNVICLNYAIGDTDGYATFYECTDALLSALNTMHVDNDRWKGVTFEKTEVPCITYASMLKEVGMDGFDFITIDAEGFDWNILKQMNLYATKLICVEWNSVEPVKKKMIEYCARFGLTKLIHMNGENLIIAR